MARKTQEEINYWFQENTIKSGMDLSLIEKILHLNNLDTPNNIIIHKNGLIYDDFARWYCDEVKECIYPKTYEECCERVNACPTVGISYDSNEDMLYNDEVDLTLLALRKLLICRNAYWKIAGEEMGLDGPWKYNMLQDAFVPAIVYQYGEVQKCEVRYKNHILVYPSTKMRNLFYENFKDLIEECKELL